MRESFVYQADLCFSAERCDGMGFCDVKFPVVLRQGTDVSDISVFLSRDRSRIFPVRFRSWSKMWIQNTQEYSGKAMTWDAVQESGDSNTTTHQASQKQKEVEPPKCPKCNGHMVPYSVDGAWICADELCLSDILAIKIYPIFETATK